MSLIFIFGLPVSCRRELKQMYKVNTSINTARFKVLLTVHRDISV